ncbi:MAG: tetratricopeptide repeat protein, partial [Pirellulaceae bacterium]
MALAGDGMAVDVPRAKTLFEQAIAAGYEKVGWVALGDLYRGDNDLHDLAKAAEAYQNAADAGDTTSLLTLARMALAGDGMAVPPDPPRAIEYLSIAADLGSTDARLRLGEMIARGEGIAQDTSLGFAILSEVAAAGDVRGIVAIGDLYANGSVGPVDGSAAIDAYQAAASRGSADAMMKLGYAYRDGKMVGADGALAVRYFNMAIDAGQAVARVVLGRGHLERRFAGVSSPVEGIETLVDAERLGVPEAAVAISNAYLNGTGVGRDARRAMLTLEVAAQDGNVQAARRLIEIYRDGHPPLISPNRSKAESYLQQFANLLDSRALVTQEILLKAAGGSSPSVYDAIYRDLFGRVHQPGRRSIV